jgi:hypothetical protein
MFATRSLIPALFALTCLTACSKVPSYWSSIGVTDSGAKVMEGASDKFLVLIYHDGTAANFKAQCMKAYAPVVAAGFTAQFPEPVGSAAQVDQFLTRGSERIGANCRLLDGGTFVTFAPR